MGQRGELIENNMQSGKGQSRLDGVSQVLYAKVRCSTWPRGERSFPETDAFSYLDITQSEQAV